MYYAKVGDTFHAFASKSRREWFVFNTKGAKEVPASKARNKKVIKH